MDNRITVRVDRCVMQIDLYTFFTQLNLSKVKKIFLLIFQEPWRNEETISALDDYLPGLVAQAETQWFTTSETYSVGYVDITFRYDLTGQQKSRIVWQNKKLFSNVKTAKSKLERYSKILALYTDLKNKYLNL